MVARGGPVRVKLGLGLLVRLSVLELPASVAAVRSGAVKVPVGGVVS
jgi:hypothetical protein